MNIIIPLGGLGERFKNDNYSKPKPLINVFGKPMIFHVIDNLKLNPDDNLIIIYNKELNINNFDSILKHKYNDIILVELNKQTEGAAETILYGLNNVNEFFLKNKCVLLDCDAFYTTNILDIYRKQYDNAVFGFIDNQEKPIYSYTKVDNFNKVMDIKEKVKISKYANSGCYCFNSGYILQKYCQQIISKNIREKNEYYTSCVIKEMLTDGHTFELNIIDIKDYICIGTPFQLKTYCSSNLNCIESKRFCFDLDNTLVTFPKIKDNYETVDPIYKNINLLQYLKSMGHYIIIHTARRMKTHNGNIGKIMKDIGKITINTLNNFNIPYDELIFGKPYADFYIDDLAVNAYHNLEKELGFYITNINERDFNEVKSEQMNIIVKRSDNKKLHGEIYYYKNIPTQIKKYFPLFIDHGETWYSIEKIKGITLSYIYLDESLSNELFLTYLAMFKEIHSLPLNSETINMSNVNIYENYSNKLKQRYLMYDYSQLKNSDNIYNKLVNYLDEYEKNNLGIKTIIHGDPVFSNCIVNENNEFKLVDMRGKLGNELTVYGDIFYDYSKIYQSLIGYDEILLDRIVSNDYKTNKISIFEKFIKEHYGESYITHIKMITNSLFFSLLPLHNNDKCMEYYNLIDM